MFAGRQYRSVHADVKRVRGGRRVLDNEPQPAKLAYSRYTNLGKRENTLRYEHRSCHSVHITQNQRDFCLAYFDAQAVPEVLTEGRLLAELRQAGVVRQLLTWDLPWHCASLRRTRRISQSP